MKVNIMKIRKRNVNIIIMKIVNVIIIMKRKVIMKYNENIECNVKMRY